MTTKSVPLRTPSGTLVAVHGRDGIFYHVAFSYIDFTGPIDAAKLLLPPGTIIRVVTPLELVTYLPQAHHGPRAHPA
jgi:hypothetical protein